MSSAEVYAKEVHNQLKRYANWLPTDNVRVGAVGKLHGKLFQPIAHIDSFGISANVVNDPNAKASYKFASSGTKETAFSASARGVPASPAAGVAATLNIAFSRADSVYFFLSQCVGSSIENLVDLGAKVLDLVRTNKWDLDFVVVTRIVTAKSATILQAQSKGASVVLEGDASGTSVSDLLKAGASVKLKSQSSVGLSIVAEAKLTPLLSLAKVNYSFIDWLFRKEPKFSPNILSGYSIRMAQLDSHVKSAPTIDFTDKIRTKNDLHLNVTLPRYGEYIDISGLLDFTAKTSGVQSGSAGRVRAAAQLRQLSSPAEFDLATRIHRKKFLSVVERLPSMDLDKKGSTEDLVKLKVTLPKSGPEVSMEPLVKLAIGTAEPKARASATAELSFDELP